MSSFISRLRRGTGPEADQIERDKYRLLVTAGPAYDQTTHKIVQVNTEVPTRIENDFMTAKIVVRVKGFRGLPSSSPSTATDYFTDPMHTRDQYSLGFTFVPKQDIPSVDTIWGNDFDHPVRDKIPPGFNTAFRIVKEFIDPGLQCDAYADAPWLYGPSLSCWFALRIGEKVGQGHDDFPSPGVMHEGADGSGREVRDKLGLPGDNEKRRKYFLDAKNRQSFVFEKGRLYSGDFYNGFLDFGNFALKLPGYTLKVIKYVGDKTHCLRYVFKNRKTGEMYFNVNFTLLWGEELQDALTKDQHELDGENATSATGATTHAANDRVSGRDQEQRSHMHLPQQQKMDGSSPKVSSDVTTPAIMELHPGDHNAIAQSISDNSEVMSSAAGQTGSTSSSTDTQVDEIAKLLEQTSTSQQRSGRFLDDID